MWNHSGGKGVAAAKQRVILGSFCWVPVSLRDGGNPVDKKGIWTTLYLEVESVVPPSKRSYSRNGQTQCSRVRPSTTQLRLYQEELQGGPGPARGRDASRGSAGRRRRRRLAWEDFVAENQPSPGSLTSNTTHKLPKSGGDQ